MGKISRRSFIGMAAAAAIVPVPLRETASQEAVAHETSYWVKVMIWPDEEGIWPWYCNIFLADGHTVIEEQIWPPEYGSEIRMFFITTSLPESIKLFPDVGYAMTISEVNSRAISICANRRELYNG